MKNILNFPLKFRCDTSAEHQASPDSTLEIKTDLGPSDRTAVVELLRCSFYRGKFPNRIGGYHDWIIDCREGLSRSSSLAAIASIIVDFVEREGIKQIAGAGLGSHLIIGAVLASVPENNRLTGLLLRPEPKACGRGRVIEGRIEPYASTLLIDDILNSGRMAIRSVKILRMQVRKPIKFLSVFEFSWGCGRRNLESEGIPVHSLATVNRL